MVAGHGQLHRERALRRVHLDLGAAGTAALLPQRPLGVLDRAVAHHVHALVRRALPERPRAGVVGAHHERASGREPADERIEGRGERLSIPVEVEVVRLEVGDHERVRREGEERAVGLVGLDDRETGAPARSLPGDRRVRAQPRVAAQVGHGRAERPRRVAARAAQRRDRHAGGGGLAVGAGDGDQLAIGQQPRQCRGAVDDGDAALAGRAHLGIVGAHRGGDDDEVDIVGEQGGVEADADAGAGRAQRSDELAVLGIRAADGEPGLEREAGDGAHPGPADAHHVHRADGRFGGPVLPGDHLGGAQDRAGRRLRQGSVLEAWSHEVTVIRSSARPCQARRATPVTTSAITSAASVMPKPRDAADMVRSRSGSRSRGSTCPVR